ncbi:hypothetical protein ABIE38_001474 [Dietzia sp. 2505]|uniref:hypothetical protein n=1 Tax=Dietzia sp. 2505 TaxID=3156457 RepID=UPI00339B5116
MDDHHCHSRRSDSVRAGAVRQWVVVVALAGLGVVLVVASSFAALRPMDGVTFLSGATVPCGSVVDPVENPGSDAHGSGPLVPGEFPTTPESLALYAERCDSEREKGTLTAVLLLILGCVSLGGASYLFIRMMRAR